jgi:hypothetical protein
VSLPSDGDHYLQLDGRDANFVSTPDTAALDITGDLDVRAEICPDWYGPSNQIVIAKWDRPTAQESWLLQIATDGSGSRVYFRFSTDGTGAGERFFSQPLPQLPDRAAIRATLDVDNGAGGNTVTFYWSDSLSGTWTMIGNPVTYSGGAATVFSGSAPLRIGMRDDRGNGALVRHPLNGRAYRFEVRNGIGGSVVASPDFRATPAGATSLTDSSGRTWTLNGAAEVRDREDRFVGEVSTWPRKWSTGEYDRYTPIQANGLMRRLGQGVKALDSTLRRRIPSGNPVAYWPMEEQKEAVQAYSPIPGVLPASVSGVDWAAVNTLPSSAALPKLTDTSGLSAPVPAFAGGSWQVEFVYNADDIIPVSNAQVISFSSGNGVIRRWTIEMRQGVATISGFLANGTRDIFQGIAIGADVFHGWTRLRFWAQDDADGSGFTWRINWQDVGGDAGGLAGTYPTGTCGSLYLVSGDWSSEMQGWSFGHLFVLPSSANALIDGSDDAYLGESAWARMTRLAGEEGFNFTRTSGALAAESVGFQRIEPLLSLLESAADGDGGLLTEDLTRIGLHYRDRSSIYTQTPLFELAYDAPGLGPDLEPVDDDNGVINDVTVTRDGGSSGRAVLESGALSVQPAPGGIGKYDASYTVSLANDNQAEPHAFWRLHLGTWDGSRFPTVSIMLHKPGAEWLIPLVQRMREGDKVRLTNLPEWVSHDDVDLIVLGWAEKLDLYEWTVTLNCVPAGPWDTAVTDHPLYATADTDGSVVATAVTSTATKLIVRTTAGPLWTADPADLPYYIRVSGEEMRVNSVTQSVSDTFTRTTSNGWGNADSGGAWARTGGADSEFSTNATVGRVSLGSVNVSRYQTVPAPSADIAVQCDVSTSVVATGGPHYYGVVARMLDSNNSYVARVAFNNTASSLTVTLQKRVGGTQTDIVSATVPGTYLAGTTVRLKFEVTGSTLRAKAWLTSAAEPGWLVTTTDTSLTAAGSVGVRALLSSANTNTLPVTASFDNFSVLNSQAFTVDRSLNGVVKAQTVGTAVNISVPPITSL